MFRIIFTIFPLLIFALITWRLWREYHHVQIIEGFTEKEKMILIRQVMALLVFLPFLLVYVVLFIIGQGVVLNLLNNSSFSLFYLLVAFVILGYIAVSSIRHRVSILRGRGQRKPLKGRSAVLIGILTLVVLLGISAVFIVGTLFD